MPSLFIEAQKEPHNGKNVPSPGFQMLLLFG
jgi:hypothetical protein